MRDRMVEVSPDQHVDASVQGRREEHSLTASGGGVEQSLDDRQETDEEYDVAGIKFVMNQAHGIYLMGMEIDWHGGLNARGFTFSNPNASKTCGCGTSFAV